MARLFASSPEKLEAALSKIERKAKDMAKVRIPLAVSDSRMPFPFLSLPLVRVLRTLAALLAT